jgi:hypothetical protein
MADAFTLQDGLSLGDLSTYLGRAARVEDGSVRLIASGGILAVYVAILYPAGLLDESPTVLGLRTFALPEGEEFDTVVPVASLLNRIERAKTEIVDDTAPARVALPLSAPSVTWAAISPPRGGWSPLDGPPTATLDAVARAGIDEVATAIPTGTGEAIVHKVRSQVWGRPLDGFSYLPAGAAFAAVSLGFLGENSTETVKVFETGPWTRLSTPRGHVLIKRRAWSLAR